MGEPGIGSELSRFFPVGLRARPELLVIEEDRLGGLLESFLT